MHSFSMYFIWDINSDSKEPDSNLPETLYGIPFSLLSSRLSITDLPTIPEYVHDVMYGLRGLASLCASVKFVDLAHYMHERLQQLVQWVIVRRIPSS
jgi:hypothetical protein